MGEQNKLLQGSDPLFIEWLLLQNQQQLLSRSNEENHQLPSANKLSSFSFSTPTTEELNSSGPGSVVPLKNSPPPPSLTAISTPSSGFIDNKDNIERALLLLELLNQDLKSVQQLLLEHYYKHELSHQNLQNPGKLMSPTNSYLSAEKPIFLDELNSSPSGGDQKTLMGADDHYYYLQSFFSTEQQQQQQQFLIMNPLAALPLPSSSSHSSLSSFSFPQQPNPSPLKAPPLQQLMEEKTNTEVPPPGNIELINEECLDQLLLLLLRSIAEEEKERSVVPPVQVPPLPPLPPHSPAVLHPPLNPLPTSTLTSSLSSSTLCRLLLLLQESTTTTNSDNSTSSATTAVSASSSSSAISSANNNSISAPSSEGKYELGTGCFIRALPSSPVPPPPPLTVVTSTSPTTLFTTSTPKTTPKMKNNIPVESFSIHDTDDRCQVLPAFKWSLPSPSTPASGSSSFSSNGAATQENNNKNGRYSNPPIYSASHPPFPAPATLFPHPGKETTTNNTTIPAPTPHPFSNNTETPRRLRAPTTKTPKMVAPTIEPHHLSKTRNNLSATPKQQRKRRQVPRLFSPNFCSPSTSFPSPFSVVPSALKKPSTASSFASSSTSPSDSSGFSPPPPSTSSSSSSILVRRLLRTMIKNRS